MRVGERRPGNAVLILSLLVVIGCSSEPEPPLDAGVSPFYPGPAATEKAAARPDAAGGASAGATASSAAGEARSDADAAGSPGSEGSLRPEDVERQLRIALRTADKGDTAKAVSSLDRILELQPTNREALLGRAFMALTQAEKAPSAAERSAAIDKARAMIDTLRRAYEKPTQPENNLFARVLYAQARLYAEQGKFDRATAVLKEGYEGGYDPFQRIEGDPAMASLRASAEYRTMLKSIDEANLAGARARVKNFIDKPLDLKFDFKLKDIDGKPLALDQLKGKVVVIDIWGTWCKPCREAIPGLIQLYRRHHRLGLEIVGLAFEKDAPSPEVATEMVKQFVKEMGVTYPCALGDESILTQIPNFHAFPTTMVLDRQGRVRFLVLENNDGVLGALDSIVQVLEAEPETPAASTPAPAAATKKAEEKPAPIPVAPATPKDAAKPK